MTKAIKFYALLLLATVTMFGCSEYDDSELRNNVSDLQSRVEKLEKWCETTNTQISALQGVVTALEAKDFVTGVTPITEGSVTVGYTITFSKSNAVTIKNGTNGKDGVNGTAPVIGVAKHTDGLYYWTVKAGAADATWMLDAEGKMIRTTGDKGADGSIGADGKTPVLSVAADTDGKLYWKVNGEWLMSDGKKVQATGDKGETGAAGSAGEDGEAGEAGKDGDSIFMKDGIDLTDPNNVTLTLADGTTKITFPRTSAVTIFDSFENFKIGALNTATSLELSLNIKDADYKGIKAELTSAAGLTTAIQTRAAGTPWEVAITAPTFKADGTIDAQPVVSITVPTGTAEGDIALLKVTIIDSKGDEHASTRVLYFSDQVAATGVTLDNTILTVKTGKTGTITATVAPANASNKKVNWTTSDATIATVTDGTVTGVKAGNATITATTDDGSFTATCTVTVENIAVTGITLTDATVSLGDKKTLAATIAPSDATIQTVTWSSSNTAVATINATTGEVTAVAKGETTITATSTSNTTVTATCKVKVEDKPNFVEVNGIKVAIGNLVADGDHGAKIGTATDNGLYFQFGSLVGWSETGSSSTVAVSPVGYTGSTTWDYDWRGDLATENAATGTGDPCKHYLKETWRLPTKDEYKALFNNVKDSSYANSGGWSWNVNSATHSTTGLTFPASGNRGSINGSLYGVGESGSYWSASSDAERKGYSLYFDNSYVIPDNQSSQAIGFPVRCVRD